MKKGFLAFSLVLILTLPLVSATPYWVKPEVYIEYAAMRYDPYIQHQLAQGYSAKDTRTAFITYVRGSYLYRIYAYNDTHIRFRILNEKGGYLTVGVRIDMNNVTVRGIAPKGKNLTPIWEQREVIKVESIPTPANSKTSEYKVYLRSLRIIGVYRIRETDGAVFDMNGTYYGHTFLWVDIDPSAAPKENETFVVLPELNWTMRVDRIFSMNDAEKTYYGKFGPPVGTLSLLGPPLVIKSIVEFTTSTWGSIRYDPATGLVLAPTTLSVMISPDLSAIGIPFATFMDEHVAYDQLVKNSFTWAGTLLLYDTNAQFQKVEEVPFSKPETPVKYVFYGSLILVGAVLGIKSSRRVKK